MKTKVPKQIGIVPASIILFALIYNIEFVDFGLMTTGRLALIVLIFLSGISGFRFFCKFFHDKKIIFLLVFAFISIYAAVLTSNSNHWESIILSRNLWFMVYCVFVPPILVHVFNGDSKKLFASYFLSAILQSIFVFIFIYYSPYKDWMFSNIKLGGNMNVMETYRSFGLSGSGGAGLSVQLALGVVAGALYLNETHQKHNKINIYASIFGVIFIMAALVFVGRTGLLAGLMVSAFFIFVNGGAIWRHFHRGSVVALLCIIFYYFYGDYIFDVDYNFKNTFDWAFSVFSFGGDGSGTIRALIDQLNNMPSIGGDGFIFGTGMISNINGSNFSGSDSGYVQTFFALGLILAVLFYSNLLIFLLYLSGAAKNLKKSIGLFLIFLCFLAEIKESFIYQYSMVQFLIAVFLFKSPSIIAKLPSKLTQQT